MPFTNIAGIIAAISKIMGDRKSVGREFPSVVISIKTGGILPGLKYYPGGKADRLAGKGVVTVGATLRHPVKVGCNIHRVANDQFPVKTDMPVTATATSLRPEVSYLDFCRFNRTLPQRFGICSD